MRKEEQHDIFVPFEQACELNNLGFNEFSLGWYDADGIFFYKTMESGEGLMNVRLDELISNRIHAPTWDVAFEWLKEYHNVFSKVVIDENTFEGKWIVRIIRGQLYANLDYKNNPSSFFGKESNEYDAKKASLDKILEIIKNGSNKR